MPGDQRFEACENQRIYITLSDREVARPTKLQTSETRHVQRFCVVANAHYLVQPCCELSEGLVRAFGHTTRLVGSHDALRDPNVFPGPPVASREPRAP